MKQCKNCGTRHQDELKCSQCGTALDDKDKISKEDTKGVPEDAWAFLVNMEDRMRADIFQSILQSENIPVIRQYPGWGRLHNVILGHAPGGVEFYVPKETMEDARLLLQDYLARTKKE